MMDARPMVTIMTDIMGSPIRRRKKIFSTLMARKKVITMLAKNEKKTGTPIDTVKK